MLRPKPRAVTPYAFPKVSTAQLASGVRVHTVAVPGAPVVTALVTLDAGADCEMRAQAGLAMLTVAALAEGTSTRDADQLAEACELLGATLETSADWSQAQCSVTVQPTRLKAAIALLAEIVKTPHFPSDGIARLRQERLSELEQQRSEPRGLADDRFLAAVFDAGSRYQAPVAGDETGVAALDHAVVAAFHRSRYRPEALDVVVVGDLSHEDVAGLCADHFGSWRTEPRREDIAPEEHWPTDCGVWFEERAAAPQSELRVGHASVPRTHPDFYALTVLNAIVGGVFTSRINLNLRERHAYTYGAFSSFDWRRATSVFEISTAVQMEHTAAALREIRSELSMIRREMVTADELSLARDYLTGVFPIRFETTGAVASAVASRLSFDLPEDYFDSYRAKIAGIEREDVLRVAQEHLDPDRLQVVVVGDPSSRTGLEEFGTLSTAHHA